MVQSNKLKKNQGNFLTPKTQWFPEISSTWDKLINQLFEQITKLQVVDKSMESFKLCLKQKHITLVTSLS